MNNILIDEGALQSVFDSLIKSYNILVERVKKILLLSI